MEHAYRDIHEYHDPCYYCKYNGVKNPKSSVMPLPVCEGCPRGMDGAHEKEEE